MTGRPASKDIRPGDYALSVGMPDKVAPTGWEWVALSDVATMATGHTPSRKHPEYWSDASINWVTATDANPADGGVINETRQKINQLGLDNSAAVLLPAGTVCLSRTGASIGYTVILGQSMATSQGFVNWICSSALDKWYLLHLLMSERRALFSFGEGSAHATIYFPVAKAFHICLPPLPEQRRIVSKIEELFSDLDAGVAALERAKANLKRYRAAVLKAAVEGKLTEQWRAENPDVEPASELLERILAERRERWEAEQLAKYEEKGKKPPKGWEKKYKEPTEPDVEGLPELPDGWCWTTVDQITGLVTKGSSPKWQGFDYQEQGVCFVRSQNVRWGSLDLSQVTFLDESFNSSHATTIIREGDVLLNLVGASIGRSAVATVEIDGANLNQAVAIIRLIPEGLRNRLLMHFLLSPPMQGYIARTKADVARANFNLDDVRPTPIPIAPACEQCEIVQEIESRLSVVDEVDSQIAANELRSARLRQSILKRAFEGKLVPQDPSDEPASELLERIKAEREAAEANGKTKKKRATRKRAKK